MPAQSWPPALSRRVLLLSMGASAVAFPLSGVRAAETTGIDWHKIAEDVRAEMAWA